MEIKLINLKEFYPYGVAHVVRGSIKIEDNNHEWYKTIDRLLQKVKAFEYINCAGGFNVAVDNKITLGFISEFDNNSHNMIYLTYQDNCVYIGSEIHFYGVEKPNYAVI